MKFNQGYRFRCVISSENSGVSVLDFLTDHFEHSTRQEWRQRIEAGEIHLDQKIPHCEDRLRSGSLLIWNRPAWIEEVVPLEFAIVFRDEFLLAVSKPSGLPTIPGGGFYENTLLHQIRREFPDARPLHRLGRATSGLVLFGLDGKTASIVHRGWSSIRKIYRALAQSVAEENTYDIRIPIGPVTHPRLGTVFAAEPIGKNARSLAKTLERRANSTLFEVEIFTGRPHQIRIHLAAIGHPLVGDPLYDFGGQPRREDPGLPGEGGYWLHAEKIFMHHPFSLKPLELVAPLPEILQNDPSG